MPQFLYAKEVRKNIHTAGITNKPAFRWTAWETVIMADMFILTFITKFFGCRDMVIFHFTTTLLSLYPTEFKEPKQVRKTINSSKYFGKAWFHRISFKFDSIKSSFFYENIYYKSIDEFITRHGQRRRRHQHHRYHP